MLDFKSIVKRTDLYNFHSHTQFCDGRANMEDFVKEAIMEGFSDYGFSPHSPIPATSPCNMSNENAEKYIAEFRRLKEKYGNRINLYLSMEIDYLDKDWGPSNKFYDQYPLDYKIGSVHFIPSFDNTKQFIDIDGDFESFNRKMSDYFHDDIEAVVRSFYKSSMDMIEAGGFDVIGHFDKIGHNASHYSNGIEDEKWYMELVYNEFTSIMDNNLIIEVNTKALAEHHRTFPNEKFYEWLKKYDAPLLINSDSHYPKLINAGRIETMEKLAKMGIYTPASL